jgi:hypothetical protein
MHHAFRVPSPAAIPAPTANAVRRGAPFDFEATVQPGPPCGGTPEGAFGAAAGAGHLYTFPRAGEDRVAAERRGVVEVRGPQGPARQALPDSIDTAWLQGLIGKPPPEVAPCSAAGSVAASGA